MKNNPLLQKFLGPCLSNVKNLSTPPQSSGILGAPLEYPIFVTKGLMGPLVTMSSAMSECL